VLRVSEIFYSLQGEGQDIGRPVVFLRLAGCNLCCVTCDTAYAWEEGEEVPIQVLRERLKVFPCRYLVVTGGEPLLQAREMVELLDLLPSWTLALETNATLWEPEVLGRFSLVTASPKLPSAGVGPFPHRVFSRYVETFYPKLQVKLVVGGEEDWEAVGGLLEEYPPLGREIPLVIQPLDRGGFLSQYQEEVRKVAEVFLQRVEKRGRDNVRFLPQLHKILWGRERGR